MVPIRRGILNAAVSSYLVPQTESALSLLLPPTQLAHPVHLLGNLDRSGERQQLERAPAVHVEESTLPASLSPFPSLTLQPTTLTPRE